MNDREQRVSGFRFRSSRGVTVNLRGQSIDSTMVTSQVARPQNPRHAELKGLTDHVFSERWTTFSVLSGRRKRGDADLLIQQGFVSQVAVESGRAIAQSKGLTNHIFTSVGPPFRVLAGDGNAATPI